MQLVEVEQELNLSPNGATLIISTLSCRSLQASKLPRGLPWWCVLVGWLLVAVTSGVAAFFTMLYGLHSGRTSSLKWLISMAVSFVESVFVTQPLKVRTSVGQPSCPPPLCPCFPSFQLLPP